MKPAAHTHATGKAGLVLAMAALLGGCALIGGGTPALDTYELSAPDTSRARGKSSSQILIAEPGALKALDGTLADLGVEQIDLFLIHWPLPEVGDYVQTWKALEKAYADGKARAIGVSNFQQAHLQRLFDETDVVPAVNQIEVHPYLSQNPLRAFNSEHGIATEAWSPIAQGKVTDDPVITEISKSKDRSPAQVSLRWHIQRGDIVFPKSVTRSRVEENFALFDFELSDDEVAQIDRLNSDERIGPDPDTFNYVPE